MLELGLVRVQKGPRGLEVARREILVNAYALTIGSGIPGALINAYGREVAVSVMAEGGQPESAGAIGDQEAVFDVDRHRVERQRDATAIGAGNGRDPAIR